MSSSKVMSLSVLANMALASGKISFGALASNMTLMSDGFHSLSDLLTDFITLIALKISKKPGDESHPYGHMRFENIASFIVGAILIITVLFMLYEAVKNFFFGQPAFLSIPMKVALLFWALVTIPVKEYLYRASFKCARKEKSQTLKANAWHHRSDAFSSGVAFVSISLSIFIPAVKAYSDLLGALIILLTVGKAGIEIAVKGIDDLMDKAPPESIFKSVGDITSTIPEITSYEKPRIRTLGQEFWIDMHIRMNPNVSLYLSHRISHKLKNLIIQSIPSVREVLIHAEPEGFNEGKLS